MKPTTCKSLPPLIATLIHPGDVQLNLAPQTKASELSLPPSIPVLSTSLFGPPGPATAGQTRAAMRSRQKPPEMHMPLSLTCFSLVLMQHGCSKCNRGILQPMNHLSPLATSAILRTAKASSAKWLARLSLEHWATEPRPAVPAVCTTQKCKPHSNVLRRMLRTALGASTRELVASTAQRKHCKVLRKVLQSTW